MMHCIILEASMGYNYFCDLTIEESRMNDLLSKLHSGPQWLRLLSVLRRLLLFHCLLLLPLFLLFLSFALFVFRPCIDMLYLFYLVSFLVLQSFRRGR